MAIYASATRIELLHSMMYCEDTGWASENLHGFV